MIFPFSVYLLALGGAFIATVLSMPLWRRFCQRFGLIDEPGHRKIHSETIVLAGGLAIFTGLLIPLATGALVFSGWVGLPGSLAPPALEYGVEKRLVQVAGISLGAAGILLVGLLDDKYELSPAWKLAGQILVAVLVASTGVRITLFVPSLLFSYALTVLWIVTLINAFNFMDNMNGLCSGLAAIASWSFAWISASAGQYLVAILAFVACGAFFGFLPYNFPRARSFLGDGGSHLAGYLMAVLAILPHFYTPEMPRPTAVLIPLLVLAVPLIDLGMVVVIRTWNGKPFYVGDTNHLSHRLTRAGLSRTTAVLVIQAAAAASSLLAVSVF